jgi:two-component system, sensor histidine kinase RpfC
LPKLPQNRLGWMTQQGEEEPPGGRLTLAAMVLAVAAAVPPVAMALVAAADRAPWPPLAAATLLALLLLMPAAVGLAATLAGWRRLVALAAAGGGDAEHATWRVLAATLLFGYALVLAMRPPQEAAAGDCLAIATAGLVAAWALLLCLARWPAASPLRRYAGIAWDAAFLSAFLHFGGSAAAGWYPLYLAAMLYAGLRFGCTALLASALAAVAGFAAVIASTAAWAGEPALAGGLLVALAVLPAFVAGAVRSLAAARAAAAAATAARRRTLLLIAETLREAPQADGAATTPLRDVVDFATLEAGAFALPIESFDLRRLVTRALAPLQESAADRGMALRWRVDPRLPPRLRGRAQALARILAGLAAPALAAAGAITIDAAAGDAGRVRLRLRAEVSDTPPEPPAAAAAMPLALRVVQRLAALAEGSFAVERPAGRRRRVAVELPLAVETAMAETALDLAGRAVVIVSEEEDLARRLAGPLADWNADPSWASEPEAALAELGRRGGGLRPVALVDGRGHLLAALSLAHRAAQSGTAAPFVVLIAEAAQIAALADVDEGGLDGFLPAPVDDGLLANALAALPLDAEPPAGEPAAAPPVGERITPIAAHPRFTAEPAAIDPRAVEGLRTLGGGPAFLREVIETFRADAGQVMQCLSATAEAGDAAGFARAAVALHRAASHLGGTQLCDLLAALREVTEGELRQHGALHLRRLDAEIDRLAAALAEFLPTAEAGRS